MLRVFCRFPWLFVWPWFFGVALASFVEGRSFLWVICLMFSSPWVHGRPMVAAYLAGSIFAVLTLSPAWQHVPGMLYIWRIERVTPVLQTGEMRVSKQMQVWGAARFRSVLPARDAGLAAAMLYGDASFAAQDRVRIRGVGLAHLVAVSGANILFLLMMLRTVTYRVVRGIRARFFMDAIGVTGIVILTGASASVVRGGLMLLLFGGASLFGRRASFGRLLLVVAMMLVWADARHLLFDAGFLLSFFACIGLLHAASPNEAADIAKKLSLRESWFTWIWTAPFQLWFFGSVSWMGLVANVLALFVVMWIQALSFIVLLAPIRLFSVPLQWFLDYLWLVIDRLSVFVSPISLAPDRGFLLMVVAYLGLLASLIHKRVQFWSRSTSDFSDTSLTDRLKTLVLWVFSLSYFLDTCPELVVEMGFSMLKLSAKNRHRAAHENSA